MNAQSPQHGDHATANAVSADPLPDIRPPSDICPSENHHLRPCLALRFRVIALLLTLGLCLGLLGSVLG